jgi:hypothetical protein
MVIGDLWEGDLLIGLSPLLVILVLVLAQLATPIGAKTVQMARISQRHGVRLTARNSHNFLVTEGLHAGWVRLVWLVLGVLWQVTDIVEAQLAKSCFAPSVHVPFFGQCHRVRVSTCKLCDDKTMQTLDFLWHRHKWASINIKWHLENVSKT